MRNNVVTNGGKLAVLVRRPSKPSKGVYCRDRCPRCGNQARCKRLSDTKAWCGMCQQGFPRR